MSQDSITNKVAQSALVTFDLEDFWPSGGLRTLHLSEIAPVSYTHLTLPTIYSV